MTAHRSVVSRPRHWRYGREAALRGRRPQGASHGKEQRCGQA